MFRNRFNSVKGHGTLIVTLLLWGAPMGVNTALGSDEWDAFTVRESDADVLSGSHSLASLGERATGSPPFAADWIDRHPVGLRVVQSTVRASETRPDRWWDRSSELWPVSHFELGSIAGGEAHYVRVDVPEPLLFDLVRPLGPRKGELEFNTLAIFPWRASNTRLEEDPVGPGPATRDRRGIEWAPEVEYAIADNFAIEFEFPFEKSILEEYKLGLQWTIGTAFDNSYIHGFQMLVEPTTHWKNWNTTLLYLGGIRFDVTWSALFMLGGRIDLEGPRNSQTFERIVNVSLFADVAESTKLGLETNFAGRQDGTSQYILVPQVHWHFQEHLEIQAGVGLAAFSKGSEQSAIMRLIYSR